MKEFIIVTSYFRTSLAQWTKSTKKFSQYVSKSYKVSVY